MSKFQRCLAVIVFILFEAYAGYRLLTAPVAFTDSMVTVFGVVMLLVGVLNLYWTFTLKSRDLPNTLVLVCGILGLILGVFCIAFSEYVVLALPTFAMIYGVMMVITGIAKLGDYIALQVMGLPRRIFWLLGAILTIIFGMIIFLYPYTAIESAWLYGGCFMIAQAAVDLVIFLLSLGA